jgi:hypothetical protein
MQRRRPLGLKLPEINIAKKIVLDKLDLSNESFDIIETVIHKFKFMNREDVFDLYNSDKINKNIKISGVKTESSIRDIAQITEPVLQLFYKSKGESRVGLDLKDIWFPFKEVQVIGQRLEKLEDKYITSWENLKHGLPFDKDLILEMARNPDLLIYGRFMNYTFASISARLYYEEL